MENLKKFGGHISFEVDFFFRKWGKVSPLVPTSDVIWNILVPPLQLYIHNVICYVLVPQLQPYS